MKLQDPDCNAAIEVKNLGYIKKGSVEELNRWLAYNVYLERPEKIDSRGNQSVGTSLCPDAFDQWTGSAVSGLVYWGRRLGLPLGPLNVPFSLSVP